MSPVEHPAVYISPPKYFIEVSWSQLPQLARMYIRNRLSRPRTQSIDSLSRIDNLSHLTFPPGCKVNNVIICFSLVFVDFPHPSSCMVAIRIPLASGLVSLVFVILSGFYCTYYTKFCC